LNVPAVPLLSEKLQPTTVGPTLHPIQIKNAINLPDQMIGRHHLVEIKRIKELALSAFPPTHHEPLPPMPSRINGIIIRESSQSEFCNTIPQEADMTWMRRALRNSLILNLLSLFSSSQFPVLNLRATRQKCP
jgi:hypothetical protein